MTTASATTSPSFAAPSNRDAAMPAATVSTCSYGASPSPRAIRHLCDRQRMVADQFNLAVGGLHRSAMALLAARAACALVPFRAAGNPAAYGRGPADALVRLRHLPLDVFRRGDCGGDMRQGWFSAVGAGTMGIVFFVSSYLCNLPWLRAVAIGWWIAMLLLYGLRHRIEVLPLSAMLMLLLLALPGFLLWRRRPAAT